MKFSTAFVFLATAFGSALAAPAAGNVQVARAEADAPKQRDVDIFEKRAALVGVSGDGVATLAVRRDNSQAEARDLETRQTTVASALQAAVTTLNTIISSLTSIINGTVPSGTTIVSLLNTISSSLNGLISTLTALISSAPSLIGPIVTNLTAAALQITLGNYEGAVSSLNAIINTIQAYLGSNSK